MACYRKMLLPVHFNGLPKIIQNKSVKDNFCSVRIIYAVVWFCGVHLQKQPAQVFLKIPQNSQGKHLFWNLFSCSSFCSLWGNMVEMEISENFLETIDKHDPLEKKFVRGNQAPFMNRDFQKAIYTRTRLRNRY